MQGRELSQADVARRLGISLAYVATLTTRGRLKAPRKERGRVWYDAAAVEAFAETWERQRLPRGKRKEHLPPPNRGPIAAEAFALIANEGVDWRGLVVRLKIDPVLAREIVTEYETTPEVERANKERERVAKEERAREREHARKRRTEDLKAHQLRLVREAKNVTIALPPGSAPEKARG